jgi:tRNA (cytidine/uridine-2'-O-)-methyltransferase
VEPLGFAITHAQLKRSGLDYWQYVQVVRHESLEAFWRTMPENAAKAFFSTKGRRSHFDHAYQPGAYLFFGNETCGLPDDLLRQHEDLVLRVPQYDTRVRSLNLSNVVSVVVYEAIRQLGA